jgi:hypothetical protein
VWNYSIPNFVVPTDDPKALAVCMNELLGSESMSMTASRRNPDVISNYSIGDMVRWHMKMLNGDTAIWSSEGSNGKKGMNIVFGDQEKHNDTTSGKRI